ncbi:hypothetical protein O9X98_14480 [Agrobacterium salinitolerans]|nr:hypothetical protein [Agrobacterium salinitolerans]
MAINADDVFNATMTQEMLAASDRRADELKNEWSALRAELPPEVRERLDNTRNSRRLRR